MHLILDHVINLSSCQEYYSFCFYYVKAFHFLGDLAALNPEESLTASKS